MRKNAILFLGWIISFLTCNSRHIESKPEVFAVLKISYNSKNDVSEPIVGGICGSAFFVNDSIAITAHHVLSEGTFKPLDGFEYCQFFLLSSDSFKVIPVFASNIVGYPSFEMTLLKFDSLKRPVKPIPVQFSPEGKGSYAISYGFSSDSKTFPIQFICNKDNLDILCYDLNDIEIIKGGHIYKYHQKTVKNSIKFYNKWVYELKIPGTVGMSGGPLLNKNNMAIGFTSCEVIDKSNVKDPDSSTYFMSFKGIYESFGMICQIEGQNALNDCQAHGQSKMNINH